MLRDIVFVLQGRLHALVARVVVFIGMHVINTDIPVLNVMYAYIYIYILIQLKFKCRK